jgi:hypothetical protein
MIRRVVDVIPLTVLLVALPHLRGQNPPSRATQTPLATQKLQLPSGPEYTTTAIAQIGGLKFAINPATQQRDTRESKITLQLEDPPTGLVANYRFAGETQFHGLAQGATSGKAAISNKIEIPPDVHLILVRIVWCNGGCPLSKPDDPPFQCPGQASTASNEPAKTSAGTTPDQAACTIDVVFVRELVSTTGDLVPAFIFSSDGLEISDALINLSRQDDADTYVLNGSPIGEYSRQQDRLVMDRNIFGGKKPVVVRQPLTGWTFIPSFHIERYPFDKSCREYSDRDVESVDIDRSSVRRAGVDNGITVAPSKVFDTFSLRQMLANTASQLAGVSGFNQASIVGAFGTLQGITRDASYVSAQLTTNATPTVSAVAANGTTGSNTLANSLGATNNLTLGGNNISCPPGSLPAVGTSGLPACAAVATALTGGSSNQTSSQLATGTTLNSAFTGVQTNNQQNTVTTTSGGQVGTIAPVPISTALPPPTNVGVAASDMLAEQVQLNSQITTLRLLLQGSLSDQYLLKGSRAIGTRQQTTVGFGISLNPPERYKHAVAEVKVWIDSPPEQDPVSVMNLLPAEKTYNVAKITSHQSAYGAGVVVEAVNIGGAAGRSKDRLYLAKDTDTVALQYPRDKPGWPYGAERVPRSTQEHIRDVARQAKIWQHIEDECAEDPVHDGDSLVFGWQFRPVLGADYVQAGERTVFAQLALPVGLGGQFAPSVHIQTRWREYDSKHQVVGAVYKGSCSILNDPNPITVISPLRVHRTTVDDVGSGILKVRAQGNFFASGFSVLSGPNTIAPATFDGRSIQFFANARDLLLTDDLKVVGEDGRTELLSMDSRFPSLCRVDSAMLSALPRPDGNSLVEVKFSTGSRYDPATDGDPHPLVLIGSQVYGLHETPFIFDKPDDGCTHVANLGVNCKYHFIAPTDALRAGETFLLRDLAWREFGKKGTIDFDPAFSSLSILGTKLPADTKVCSTLPAPPDPPAPKKSEKAAAPTCVPPQLLALSGFQFNKFQYPANLCPSAVSLGCLEIKRGLELLTPASAVLDVTSKTAAVLQLPFVTPLYDYKSLRFIWHSAENGKIEWDLPIPPETKTPITASAILNMGDSAQIVFSGVEMEGTHPTATFDGLPVSTFLKYDKAKKTLTALITTSMTSKPGHKELTLTDDQLPPGSGPTAEKKQVQLPFDVTRR